MPILNIQGTVINMPDSGASANWAPGVIAFAEAVAGALASVVGAFDVPPQIFVIDAFNPGSNLALPNLTFSTADVRAAFIRYSVYRTTTAVTVSEAGEIVIVYNPSNLTGQKWTVSRIANGDASVIFSVTDVGQVQVSTLTLAGTNHQGVINYSATASLQA